MSKTSYSSDHSIFTKRANPNIKIATETSEIGQAAGEGIASGLIGKIKGYINLSSNDEEAQTKLEANMGFIEKIKYKLKNVFEVERSYTVFFLFLAVGIGLIFLSLIFLPVALLSPQKFVSLFSLGSLVTLISFIFIYGTSAYIEMLFTKSRVIFSVLFITSIVIGLYFCFSSHSYYLISLICAVVQLITLIIFTLSFIPGGSLGISFIKGMLMSPVNSLWGKITGSSEVI